MQTLFRPRMLVLIGLYAAQGLPFGFFTQAVPILLTQRGILDRHIGLTYLLSLPWALKFLAAPWIDTHRNKAIFIHAVQAFVALLLLGFGAFSLYWRESGAWLAVFLGVVGLTNAASAAQDVATDALAIEILPAAERGLANGVQVAAYRVGMILGGGILPMLLGAERTLPILGSFVLLTSLPMLAFRRHIALPNTNAATSTHSMVQRLWNSLARSEMRTWIAVLLLYKLGEALATSMLRPMLIRFGVAERVVYSVFGTTGFVSGLIGAMLGGMVATWMPRHKALFGLALFQAFTILFWIPAASGKTALWILHAACAIEHIGSGMATAALFAVMMDATRPRHEATDYAVQASVVVLGSGLGSVVGGYTTALGYSVHIALGAALAMAAAVLVRLLDARNALPRHTAAP